MSLILTLEDDSDPYRFSARAVQRNETQWDVEYFRDGVLCSDGGIGTPPPNLPPVATLKATLEELRKEADYWAARGGEPAEFATSGFGCRGPERQGELIMGMMSDSTEQAVQVIEPELITMPSFNGCDNGNPDLCSCAAPAIQCVVCDDEVEDGQEAWSIRVPCWPWMTTFATDQEWVDYWWHPGCDMREGVPSFKIAIPVLPPVVD